MTRRLTLLALLLASVDLRAQQTRDSAGAKLISYPANAVAPARWTVDPTPIVRIGGSEGEGPKQLSLVLGIARLGDGRIVIADGGSTQLRVFSPTGDFIRAIGRDGRGPGEFSGIQFMLRSADTLVVHERTSELEIYTADGTLLRTYPRPSFPERTVSSWHGLLSDGSGVVQAVDPITDSTSDQVTATASLGIRPANANAARGFTHIPVFERVRRQGRQVGLFLGAVSRVAVMGERICSGYSIRYEIQCFDRLGKLITRTTRALTPGPVTEAEIAEFKEGYAAANKTQPADRLKQSMDMLTFADQRSAFGRFVPSTTGELWVGPFVVLESFIPGRRGTVIPEKPTTWSVYDRDGRWAADVVLPKNFSLLDAGKEYVAGIELDENDVERVVLYRLKR